MVAKWGICTDAVYDGAACGPMWASAPTGCIRPYQPAQCRGALSGILGRMRTMLRGGGKPPPYGVERIGPAGNFGVCQRRPGIRPVGRGIPDAPTPHPIRGRQGCRPLRYAYSMVRPGGGTHRSRPTVHVGRPHGWNCPPHGECGHAASALQCARTGGFSPD